jgi:hypothetical protein
MIKKISIMIVFLFLCSFKANFITYSGEGELWSATLKAREDTMGRGQTFLELTYKGQNRQIVNSIQYKVNSTADLSMGGFKRRLEPQAIKDESNGVVKPGDNIVCVVEWNENLIRKKERFQLKKKFLPF